MDVYTPEYRRRIAEAEAICPYLKGMKLDEAMRAYPQFEFRVVSCAMTADYCPTRINVRLGSWAPETRPDLAQLTNQPIPSPQYILDAHRG